MQGRSDDAGKIVSEILVENSGVILTDLNKSNAFLGNTLYRNANWKPLENIYTFRGRITDQVYSKYGAEDMIHIPLNKRSIVGSYRYSVPGIPCIYLAANSYVVWKEMNCPELSKLAVSSININDSEILNNKIIDLTIPVDSLYDFLEEAISSKSSDEVVKYIISCIKSTPLIIACSVVCNVNSERKFKIEYLIPQLIMRNFADNINGVAYRSNRIASRGLYATNLAIPIVPLKTV